MSLESEQDPGEEIAEAIVEKLNGIPLSLTFTAEQPEDITQSYELERPELTVLVAPFDEESEHIDRGGSAMETFQTNVVVIRQLSSEFTRSRLSKFTRELKLALRGFHLLLDDGCRLHWVGDSTPTKYDPEKIRELNQFHAIIRTAHRGIV